MSAPKEPDAVAQRDMVRELRRVRGHLREMRSGLEQTILDLQTARLAAQEVSR